MLRAAACVAVALAWSPRLAVAQGGALLQGVIDLEGWKTDSASALLARGSGKPAGLARLDVWGAIEPVRNLVIFGEYLAEGGAARYEAGRLSEFKQGGVRLSPTDAFTLSAGKVPQVVGAFTARSLSSRNPLIGSPDGYSLDYPVGARADGSIGVVDYHAGVLSLPLYRDGYTPVPTPAARPSAAIGVTPFTGLRVGASTTDGAYLNEDYTAAQLRGADWKSFRQRIIAADVQFSRGYFETNAEINRNSYDVPGRGDPIRGLMWYVEPKYTLTPRMFVALRVEQNDYPFISAFGPLWVANGVTFNDAEAGIGYRPGASQLLKVSVRMDHWLPNSNPQAPHDNGYALAVQFSQTFDVGEWVAKRY